MNMTLVEMDRYVNLLTDFMDVQSRRAEIVATNIANADTPGFKAMELDFREYLRTAAESAFDPQENSQAAMMETLPQLVEREGNAVSIDGNSVDAGQEMATLANAGGQFMFGAQMLQSRFRAIRAAIREGR
ncbi:MAG: flagellar basal body rod protein FlgB [Blastocatellia bacterium]|nr:flagellar basal body rod protein FlgB [Blastocatellia bacterium]